MTQHGQQCAYLADEHACLGQAGVRLAMVVQWVVLGLGDENGIHGGVLLATRKHRRVARAALSSGCGLARCFRINDVN